MKFLLALVFFSPALRVAAAEGRDLMIIVSEPGDSNYETEFRRQATAWQSLGTKAEMRVKTIGLGEVPEAGDRPALEKALAACPRDGGDLWLVWIGHGSYDGRTANFNLRGPDIDAAAVRGLLEPMKRRLIILNLFSASAPFLPVLSGGDRVIVSANRGEERNFSRFGGKLADALASKEADLDADGALSLLEAVLHADAGVRAFYEDAQRVLQEHAAIDDNGDTRPTPLASFQGLRSESADADGALAREIHFLKSSADPLPPEARARRAELETAIDALRKRKQTLPEDEYYSALETLLREMARLYGKTGG